MKLSKIFITLFVSLSLASCGPIIGQIMKSSEGLKEFKVKKGDIASLKSIKNLLVYGPFGKGKKGWYLCRGEDTADMRDAFNERKTFASQAYIERDPEKVESVRAAFRAKSAEELKSELNLKALPDAILFGKILYRDKTVAPTRGVIMDLKLELEFYNIKSKKSVIIEIHARKLAQELMPFIIDEINNRIP